MKLYALSFQARRRAYEHDTDYTTAENMHEASIIAVQKCRMRFPEDTYRDHSEKVVEVPSKIIKVLAKQCEGD